MVKWLVLVLGLLALTGVALEGTFRAVPLVTVPPGREIALPEANPPDDLRISLLDTGFMRSRAGFVYRGGDLGSEYLSGMAALLLDHPDGRYLFDTGFGRDVDEQVKALPALMRWLTTYEKGEPAADQLAAHGFDASSLRGILISHSHWDHVSALPDFPGVPVVVPPEEIAYVRSENPGSALARSFGDVRWETYEFDDGPVLGFERSHDLFGDGSAVLVPTPGHTPGSVSLLVTLPDSRRYFFVGDLVWAAEGISIPAERPWLSRRLVDLDAERVRQAIAHVHEISTRFPEIVVVPAHDRRVHETLAWFPKLLP